MKKYIPDFITTLNLLCGVLGIVFTFKARFDIAFPLIIAAAVFDFLDGFAARMLDSYSELGKELDSLSDIVSFGVLPSLMLYKLMASCNFTESLWCFTPLVIAVCSGLRLAKFNVDNDQHEQFYGLPTPACAMICGSLCYFVAFEQSTFVAIWCTGRLFIPVLSCLLSALLVSRIPMFSMKFSRGKKSEGIIRKKRVIFALNTVLIVLVVILLGLNWSLVVLLEFLMYVLMNVISAACHI